MPKKLSFDVVPETCPDVEAIAAKVYEALDQLSDANLVGRMALRNALEDALQDVRRLKKELADMESERDEWRSSCAALQKEIDEMEDANNANA
jgi:chromosome segregation ATPase